MNTAKGFTAKGYSTDIYAQLEGKSLTQKDKILRELAMQGIMLPEGKTHAEKQLITKIRVDLGLPPEPKSMYMKIKHTKAAEAGFLQPLEGKTRKEKEIILQGLIDMGIPLPEECTASERALIAKVKLDNHLPTLLRTEKIHKEKTKHFEVKRPESKVKILEGKLIQQDPIKECKTVPVKKKYTKVGDAELLHTNLPNVKGGCYAPPIVLQPDKKCTPRTPIVDTQLEHQKYKVLRELAMQGTLLPEGTTPTEKKLIAKIRDDLGLPPEPKTVYMKNKHAKAADIGLLQPLEGKTFKDKEKILRGLADMGIMLPDGRTASERTLIAKIKAESRASSILPLPEKARKAKPTGQKLLKGKGIPRSPLPERKVIDKNFVDFTLSPALKIKPMKQINTKVGDTGLLQTLEGKTTKEKEKILKTLADMGLPLPDGRTTSEKALIAKVKTELYTASIIIPEKIFTSKATGSPLVLEVETNQGKLTELNVQSIPISKDNKIKNRKLADEKIALGKKLVDNKDLLKHILLSDPIREIFGKGNVLTHPESQTALQKVLSSIIRELQIRDAGILPDTLTTGENAVEENDTVVTVTPISSREKVKISAVTPIPSKVKIQENEKFLNLSKSICQIYQTKRLPQERLLASETKTCVETLSKIISQLITNLSCQSIEKRKRTLKQKGTIKNSYSECNFSTLIKSLKYQNKISSAVQLTVITPKEIKTGKVANIVVTRPLEEKVPKDDSTASLHTTFENNIVAELCFENKSLIALEQLHRDACACGTPLKISVSVCDLQAEKYIERPSTLHLSLSNFEIQSDKIFDLRNQNEQSHVPSARSSIEVHRKPTFISLENLLPAELKLLLKTQTNLGLILSERSFIRNTLPRPYSSVPKKRLVAKSKSETDTYMLLRNKLRVSQRTLIHSPLTADCASKDQINTAKEKNPQNTAENGYTVIENILSQNDLQHDSRTGIYQSPTLISSKNKNFTLPKTEKLFTLLTIEMVPQLDMAKSSEKKALSSHLTSLQELTMNSIENSIKFKVSEVEVREKIEKTKKETCDRGCGSNKKKIRFKHSYVKLIVSPSRLSSSASSSALCNLVDKFDIHGKPKAIAPNIVSFSFNLKTDNMPRECPTTSTEITRANRANNKTLINKIKVLYDKSRQINNLSKLSIFTIKNHTGVESLNIINLNNRFYKKAWDKGIRDNVSRECILNEKLCRSYLNSSLILVKSENSLTSRTNTTTSLCSNHFIEIPEANSNIEYSYYLVSDVFSSTSMEPDSLEECCRNLNEAGAIR